MYCKKGKTFGARWLVQKNLLPLSNFNFYLIIFINSIFHLWLISARFLTEPNLYTCSLHSENCEFIFNYFLPFQTSGDQYFSGQDIAKIKICKSYIKLNNEFSSLLVILSRKEKFIDLIFDSTFKLRWHFTRFYLCKFFLKSIFLNRFCTCSS